MPRRWWLSILVLFLVTCVVLGAMVLYRLSLPRLRGQVVDILSTQLGSTVELGGLDVSLGPIVTVSGTSLVLHHKRYREGPPFIRIERFTLAVPALSVLRRPVHISSLELNGLHIFIPPGGVDKADATAGDNNPSDFKEKLRGPTPIVIDRVTSSDAVLEMASRKPGRPPKTFLIHDVRLTSAAFDRPVAYEAHLTNPTPRGLIRAAGKIGPWNVDDPSATPVSGDYTFAKANMDTIKGLGGTLDSTGQFKGPLEKIAVTGTTRTPDFSLDIGGEPVNLDTEFSALVDGTSGDTFLNLVRGMLGQTPITAKGGVFHTPGRKGRTISLDATIDRGRLEDVLRLAMKFQPPAMRGGLVLNSLIELPPGQGKVIDRLYLKGQFHVASALFSSNKIQDKIDELSRRARGQPGDERADNVASDVEGDFVLRDGILTLSTVSFSVRGATIQLHGTYALKRSMLDFAGTARLQARASEMVKGWKRFPLKLIDPLLARDGAGTLLPITISGPVGKPEFGVQMGKVLHP